MLKQFITESVRVGAATWIATIVAVHPALAIQLAQHGKDASLQVVLAVATVAVAERSKRAARTRRWTDDTGAERRHGYCAVVRLKDADIFRLAHEPDLARHGRSVEESHERKVAVGDVQNLQTRKSSDD